MILRALAPLRLLLKSHRRGAKARRIAKPGMDFMDMNAKCGVSEGIRTPGRWSHNPELYQLSYAHHKKNCRRNNSTIPEAMP